MNRREFLAAIAAVSSQKGIFRTPDETTGPILTRLPYIQNARANRATIMWATRDLGEGVVAYTTNGVNFSFIEAKARTFSAQETTPLLPFTQYQADLTGLTPDTAYTYRLFLNGEDMNVLPRFRTSG